MSPDKPDSVDEAIAAVDAPAEEQPPPPDLSSNVTGVANLRRDASKGISISVPNDFQPSDLQAIMEMSLQLLQAALVARMNPLTKVGLVVPDKKIVRIS